MAEDITEHFVGVDAGLIWIGDPCYVMGDDATNRVRDWVQDFCEKLPSDCSTVTQPLGDGVGVAVPSGFGDGTYKVTVTYSNEGPWGKRVKSALIEFLDEEEDDDEGTDWDEADEEWFLQGNQE